MKKLFLFLAFAGVMPLSAFILRRLKVSVKAPATMHLPITEAAIVM